MIFLLSKSNQFLQAEADGVWNNDDIDIEVEILYHCGRLCLGESILEDSGSGKALITKE